MIKVDIISKVITTLSILSLEMFLLQPQHTPHRLQGRAHVCDDLKVKTKDFLSGITSQRRASSQVVAIMDLANSLCVDLLTSNEMKKVSWSNIIWKMFYIYILIFSCTYNPRELLCGPEEGLLQPEEPDRVPDHVGVEDGVHELLLQVAVTGRDGAPPLAGQPQRDVQRRGVL